MPRWICTNITRNCLRIHGHYWWHDAIIISIIIVVIIIIVIITIIIIIIILQSSLLLLLLLLLLLCLFWLASCFPGKRGRVKHIWALKSKKLKITFEIPHELSYLHIERYDSYPPTLTPTPPGSECTCQWVSLISNSNIFIYIMGLIIIFSMEYKVIWWKD